MTNCKRLWMKLSQAPEAPPMSDRGLAQTKILQLRTPHHPVLAVRQLGYRPLDLASP